MKKSILTKNITRRIVVSILSLAMVFSFSGAVFGASHAKDGSNVIPSKAKWTSFSICTREDGGSWEDSLKEVYRTNADGSYFLDVNGNKVRFTKGVDYATEGYINGYGKNTSSEVTFFCKSTGWDGEYASMTRNGPSVLVGDNPWGMTLTMTGIPVELGRYYTLEFDVAGDLAEAHYNPNAAGTEEDPKTTYTPKDKHVLLKAYDYNSNGEPSAAFERVEQDKVEISKDGFILIKKTEEGQEKKFSHIVAKLKIPESPDDWGGGKNRGIYSDVGIKFALGANLVSYPDEGAMRGNIYIKNLKLTAGKQYIVKYYDGNAFKAQKFVNDEESATSVNLSKKNHTLVGFNNIATGKRYNFSNLLSSNLNLRAVWTKTPAPKKAKIKVKSKAKKKETVTFGSNTNVQGYQVKYSYNSKFKKKSKFKTKTKNSKNTETYTIKSLKSGSVVYVKTRGYNLDSTGKKIYGKWSKRKAAYVK